MHLRTAEVFFLTSKDLLSITSLFFSGAQSCTTIFVTLYRLIQEGRASPSSNQDRRTRGCFSEFLLGWDSPHTVRPVLATLRGNSVDSVLAGDPNVVYSFILYSDCAGVDETSELGCTLAVGGRAVLRLTVVCLYSRPDCSISSQQCNCIFNFVPWQY